MEKISSWDIKHSRRTLDRILPRLRERFSDQIERNADDWPAFLTRLEEHFPRLFSLLHDIYGREYDFFYFIEDLISLMAQAWFDRPADLRELDHERENNPTWYQSNEMLGAVCYVDLYARDLEGLRARLPYFKDLGITYLHLMPLFLSPEGENDGGYAVSSYRHVSPAVGTMEQLSSLAREFRKNGISLVLDFVFNHTSNEHQWALKARQGQPFFEEFYYLFDDYTLPEAYQRTLREIFPEQRPGSFTYDEEMDRWIWTTFHSYQWDLNYSNPAVFNQMAREILFLANVGIEILRLDAVAFIWKVMGTDCENLPEAHMLIQAFNAVARITAPALIFKSEAIVHPDEVSKYISQDECQISYNPLLMAMLWNTLATRDTRLLKTALAERFQLPDGCSWVNYVRSHDDIGWTFADEDAHKLNINAYDHRQFLNNFFTGRFPGSFARGLPFQENPRTGDMRVSGTCASLAGLEKALMEQSPHEIELAIRRICLIHAVILTIGGIPLIYLGDEIGQLNDYSFRNDPDKASDSRWVHRPNFDWEQMQALKDPESPASRIFSNLTNLINLRRAHSVFARDQMQVMDTRSDKILGFVREREGERCLVLMNFSEEKQLLPANLIRLYGLAYRYKNLLSGEFEQITDQELEPFEYKFFLT